MEDYCCSLPSICNLFNIVDGVLPAIAPSPISCRGPLQSEELAYTSASIIQRRGTNCDQVAVQFLYARKNEESANVGSRLCSRQSAAIQHRGSLAPPPPLNIDKALNRYNFNSSQGKVHFSFGSKSSNHRCEVTSALESKMYRPQAPCLLAQLPPSKQQYFSIPTQDIQVQVEQSYWSPSVWGSMIESGQPLPRCGGQEQDQEDQALRIAFPTPGAQQLWHHHYLRQSQSYFRPRSWHKYSCPTCNKAFSRPSSLQIHSYSHTGEKPYKCAYPRCGKTFSVPSNMKRHERACHDKSAVGARPRSG